MVINLAKTNPQGFELDEYRNPEHITDAIIYEGSVRDFTMDESSGVFHNGKFLGLTEANTTNHFGEATALDYISDLGITHVQILPAFDFETVDEKIRKHSITGDMIRIIIMFRKVLMQSAHMMEQCGFRK